MTEREQALLKLETFEELGKAFTEIRNMGKITPDTTTQEMWVLIEGAIGKAYSKAFQNIPKE